MSEPLETCVVCAKAQPMSHMALCWKCNRGLCCEHETCACGAREEPPHVCRCETCGEQEQAMTPTDREKLASTSEARDRVVRELCDWAYEREATYTLETVNAIVERAYDAGRASMRSEVVAWLRGTDGAEQTRDCHWAADAIESGSTSPEGLSPERASGEPKERP